jgi:hypothetical protein
MSDDFDPDEVDSADVDWKTTAENLQCVVIDMQRQIRLYAAYFAAVRETNTVDEALILLVNLVNKLKTGVPDKADFGAEFEAAYKAAAR